MNRKLVAACCAALLSLTAQTAARADTLDVGAYSGSGCCSFGTRGYWFTAPVDFTIDGLSMPTAAAAGTTFEVVRLNGVPPTYSGTTNSFTSLAYWDTDQSSVLAHINVQAGDVIGVLGHSGLGFTPYGSGPYNTTLGGYAITLSRLGFQANGPAHDLWTEAASIGVIGMQYSLTTAAVPEPESLAMMLAGLALVAGVSRRKKAAAQA